MAVNPWNHRSGARARIWTARAATAAPSIGDHRRPTTTEAIARPNPSTATTRSGPECAPRAATPMRKSEVHRRAREAANVMKAPNPKLSTTSAGREAVGVQDARTAPTPAATVSATTTIRLVVRKVREGGGLL